MKISLMLKERRMEPRLSYYGDVICKHIKSDQGNLQIPFVCKAKNISAYGICLRTNGSLKKGDMVEIRFVFKAICMNVICEVIWDRYVTAGSVYECGLSFKYIKEGDCESLKRAIYENLYKETMGIISN